MAGTLASKILSRSLRILSLVGVLSVLAIAGFIFLLYLNQAKMIFPGVQPRPLLYQQMPFTEVRLPVYDDEGQQVELQGWVHRSSQANNRMVLIYFGGNAEDVAARFSQLADLAPAVVVAFNYRGYAASGGHVNEKNVYRDALNIYDFAQAQLPDAEVVVVGRSIGSVVAGYLSREREVLGTVLITPLQSVRAIVNELYPVAPDFLLRNPMLLEEHARHFTSPALVVVAGRDEIIPEHHSLATYEAIPAEKRLVRVAQATHNNIFSYPNVLQEMNVFFAQLAQTPYRTAVNYNSSSEL